MKMLPLLLCLCSMSSVVCAQGLNASSEHAYDALGHVSVFAVGGVGFAGTRSPGESALRVLLKQKQASVAFQQLVKSATPEGKMYALLGLSLVAPGHLAPQMGPYLASTVPVHTMSGCISMTEKMGAVVQQISKGNYRLYFDQKPAKPSSPVRVR